MKRVRLTTYFDPEVLRILRKLASQHGIPFCEQVHRVIVRGLREER